VRDAKVDRSAPAVKGTIRLNPFAHLTLLVDCKPKPPLITQRLCCPDLAAQDVLHEAIASLIETPRRIAVHTFSNLMMAHASRRWIATPRADLYPTILTVTHS
jgi:hypothetical protein